MLALACVRTQESALRTLEVDPAPVQSSTRTAIKFAPFATPAGRTKTYTASEGKLGLHCFGSFLSLFHYNYVQFKKTREKYEQSNARTVHRATQDRRDSSAVAVTVHDGAQGGVASLRAADLRHGGVDAGVNDVRCKREVVGEMRQPDSRACRRR